MRRQQLPDLHARLLPAGRRWGFGAHSVVPYLTYSLQARAAEQEGESISNPVFSQMENTLRTLQRRH